MISVSFCVCHISTKTYKIKLESKCFVFIQIISNMIDMYVYIKYYVYDDI